MSVGGEAESDVAVVHLLTQGRAGQGMLWDGMLWYGYGWKRVSLAHAIACLDACMLATALSNARQGQGRPHDDYHYRYHYCSYYCCCCSSSSSVVALRLVANGRQGAVSASIRIHSRRQASARACVFQKTHWSQVTNECMPTTGRF